MAQTKVGGLTVTKVIDIKDKRNAKECESLVAIAKEYDVVSLKHIEKGVDLRELSGIMASRLGELVRLFDGDKEALKGMVYNIIHDKTYSE